MYHLSSPLAFTLGRLLIRSVWFLSDMDHFSSNTTWFQRSRYDIISSRVLTMNHNLFSYEIFVFRNSLCQLNPKVILIKLNGSMLFRTRFLSYIQEKPNWTDLLSVVYKFSKFNFTQLLWMHCRLYHCSIDQSHLIRLNR